MSGTSFDSKKTDYQAREVSFPILSVALRAGLLGLGLVLVKRTSLFSTR